MTCSTDQCGVGGWDGPLPGDPDNISVLTATWAFGGIDVAWTMPATNPFAVAYAQVYRSQTSDFATAVLISTAGGSHYFDKINPAEPTVYYYWIKFVSINGTEGTEIGPASATANPLIAQIIEDLTGKIDSGLLAQSLRSDIERITLNYEELTGEIANRVSANSTLSAALAQLQGTVDTSIALISTEVTRRTEGDSALVSQVNSIAAANASNLALIQSESTSRVTADSALATQITTVAAQAASTAAAVITEQTARANADSALSSSITTVAATANGKNKTYSQSTAPTGSSLVAGDIWFDTSDNRKAYRYSGTAWAVTDDARIATTAAAVVIEQTARANADSALATQITTAQSTLNASIASAQIALQTNINTVDGKVTSIGALYTAKVTVNGLVGGFGVYNDGSSVEAGFDVDTFWVGKTGANKKKPFIITGGVVYIDSAFISSLSATKITTGALANSSAISSSNYVAGSAGWNVNGNGNAEFNNVTVRGSLKSSSLYTGSVYRDVESGQLLNSLAVASVQVSYIASTPEPWTSTSLRFYGSDYHASVPANQRIRTAVGGGELTLSISAYAVVDHYFTLWYRLSGGSWTPLVAVVEPQGGYGSVAAGFSTSVVFAKDQYVDFGVSATNTFQNYFGPDNPAISDLTVIVQAANL